MRIIVYGAGAVGGVVGARLFQAGHDVVLIARGAHRDAIATRGLRLRTADEDVTLPVPVVGTPDEITFRPDDVVLLGMKSQDTVDAALALVAHAGPDVAVVSLQNGVANEPALLRWFANVYGICVMAPTSHLEAGVVQANAIPISGLLDIGRYPHGVDDTARTVADALSSATFESIPRPDIMRWKHCKLLMNLGNAVQAAYAPGDDAHALVRAARHEGADCLDAAGIDRASVEEDRERRGDKLQVRPIDGAHRGGGSTWQSLERGTGSVEVDYLNGEIARIGREIGFPTPVNARLCRDVKVLARDRRPPGSVDAAPLLRELAL
jgi:2-dehydropantoate 2-reductase